jgi:flagellar motor switch protein FliN/FliY
MIGGDGTNISGELSELHLSAISEAMNQMMGSAATSISSMLEKRVNISPPTATVIDLYEHMSGENIAEFLKGSFVQVSFHMVIGDLVDSLLMQLYPFEFARDLYKQFVHATAMEPDIPAKPPVNNTATNTPTPPPAPAPQAPSPQQMPPQAMQPGYMPYPYPYPPQGTMPQAAPYMMPVAQDVNVQQVQFAPFNPMAGGVAQPENIDLLMDVPLEVTVELGRTSKSIKEILDFSPGTIIELNRLAGEPIDVLVNGKYVAKGEVVVMEEAFGIRVTEIIKQKQMS